MYLLSRASHVQSRSSGLYSWSKSGGSGVENGIGLLFKYSTHVADVEFKYSHPSRLERYLFLLQQFCPREAVSVIRHISPGPTNIKLPCLSIQIFSL